MRVYAHRGASIEFPENTLAAFRRALDLGAPGIELDIHLSKEGIPVVLHDESVDRTTDGVGAVNELNLDEIKALDAGNGEQIPTLREVFELVGDRAHFNLEIKTAVAAEAMLKELENFPQVRWATSCFDWTALDYVHAQRPDADCWLATFGTPEGGEAAAKMIEGHTEYPQAAQMAAMVRSRPVTIDVVIAKAKSLGSTSVSIYYEALTPEIIATLHENKLEAWAWTINEVDEAREYMGRGIDAICTDAPGEMLKLVHG
ncbi:MAG: glycerophosphodiester phosphodiesterase [Thermomicrobiales bacterium]